MNASQFQFKVYFLGHIHISTCHRTDLDEVTATLNACGGMGVALTPLVARDEALRLP